LLVFVGHGFLILRNWLFLSISAIDNYAVYSHRRQSCVIDTFKHKYLSPPFHPPFLTITYLCQSALCRASCTNAYLAVESVISLPQADSKTVSRLRLASVDLTVQTAGCIAARKGATSTGGRGSSSTTHTAFGFPEIAILLFACPGCNSAVPLCRCALIASSRGEPKQTGSQSGGSRISMAQTEEYVSNARLLLVQEFQRTWGRRL